MDEHQVLENLLHFIERNYYESIKSSDAAEASGCSVKVLNRILDDNFGLSFVALMKKYRLRRAAREVHMKYKSLDAIGIRNGFKPKYFYGEFKKEFGMTPVEYQASREISDMPLKLSINGYPLKMEYKVMNDVEVEGYPVPVQMTENFNILKNMSYVFKHPSSHVDMSCKEKTWGVWWHDYLKDNRLYYLMAREVKAEEDPSQKDSKTSAFSPRRVRLHITGGKYAVFSVSRGKNYFDTANHAIEMAWYAFRFWVPINFKETDKWGFTYETFDEDNVYLYVPLTKGFGGIEIEKDTNKHMIDRIIQYIDEHILEIADVDDLKEHFGNHDSYYRSQFMSCYGLSLSEYITKRRFYILAKRIQYKLMKKKDLMERYHYSKYYQFERDFEKIFGVTPDQCDGLETMQLINLKDYFAKNFSKISISKKKIEDTTFAGKVILSPLESEEKDTDIPRLTVAGMTETAESDAGNPLPKIAMYEYKMDAGQITYNYVVGSVIDPVTEMKDDSDSHKITVEGGTYLYFSVSDSSVTMLDSIRMLVRCVEHVWMYDNWLRTDFRTRACFYYYDGTKIYYCVPVYS